MRHYATACRESQVDVLAGSMARHCRPFTLHVLAWDWVDEIRRVEIGDGDEATILFTPRDAFLSRHPELAPERLPGPRRRPVDEICSVRWQFFADVMEATGQPVTAIDGDQFFFGSPEPMFNEIGSAGCAVSPHRFPAAADGLPGPTVESHSKFSRFNGGWSYWADPKALRRQAELSREWCYTGFRTMPDGRVFFGDQGYLELIHEEFDAHVILHPGVNLSPWNANRHHLEQGDGGLTVDGEPVISYHFSSLKLALDESVAQFADASYCLPDDYKALVYAPYLEEMRRCR